MRLNSHSEFISDSFLYFKFQYELQKRLYRTKKKVLDIRQSFVCIMMKMQIKLQLI